MTVDPAATESPYPTRPASFKKSHLQFYFFRPRWPVRWLAPGQLLLTGLQVALADRLGAYLDKRELQEVFSKDVLDESVTHDTADQRSTKQQRDELWLDYVADTGDGFNPTYAVASLLGQESLKGDKGEVLQRGQVLIMGGDQVYPTPSPEAYDDRLRGPFRAALPGVAGDVEPPSVYALPGNHDWYDGLTAFFRVFTGAKTTIGAWTTQQQRSYFAIRLPHNWWLFALDAQQGAHIDDPQLNYFRTIIQNDLQDNDRVILCTPEPAWVKGDDDANAYKAVDYFMRKVIAEEGQEDWLRAQAEDPNATVTARKLTVPVMISGDWHHYSRYQSATGGTDARHLITSGTGGAYLYGTHHLPRTLGVPSEKMRPPKTLTSAAYTLKKTFPSKTKSRWLGFGAPVRLPLRNFSFVVMLAVLQGLHLFTLRQAEGRGATAGVITMSLLFFLLTLFLAAGLTSGSRPWFRVMVVTLLHTAAQLAIGRVLVKYWADLPALDTSGWKPTDPSMLGQWNQWDGDHMVGIAYEFLKYVQYSAAAGLASAIVVAFYLIIASWVGLNFNELFSSQRIEGYKGFLRMHITRDGLTLHAIGLRRTRRYGPGFIRWQWKAAPKAPRNAPWFTSRGKLRHHIIETIHVPGAPKPPQA